MRRRVTSVALAVSLVVSFVLGFGAMLTRAPAASTLDEAACGALFKQANDAYEKGDFGGAVSGYRRILDGERENATVHYNLGNAYLKLGELGEALASYRRAERLSPRSADIRENLAIARARRADIAPPAALSPVSALRSAVARVASLRTLTAVADALYYGAVAMAVMLLTGRGGRRIRRLFYVVAPVAAVLLVLALVEVQDRRHSGDGVLVSPQAEARSGPGTEYTTLFTLHEAAEFTIEDERRDWYMISIGGNLRGWVPAEAVEPIAARGEPHAPA